MSELPEGWAECTLSEVGEWTTGGTPSRKNPRFFDGDIPWVKSGDLNDGVISSTSESLTKEGVENSAAKLLPTETIIVALYGATIGKVGYLAIEAATNQACAACTPNRRLVEPRFVFHYLCSQRAAFVRAGHGGAQPNISNEIVRGWRCPLPPLAEQRRIVERVETLLAATAKPQEHLHYAAELLEACKVATTRSLTESESGRHVPLSRLGRWVSGGTPSRSRSDYWTGGDIPWVSPKDMKIDFLHDAQEHITTTAVDGSAARVLPTGCVLVVVRGMILAHSFPVAVNRIPVAVNQDIRALLPSPGIEPDFVLRALQASRIEALEKVKEATHGTRRLEMDDLLSLEIHLPKQEAQRSIAREIDELQSLARSVEARIACATRRAKALPRAILAKAFAGELVPTEAELARREGRSYEPASVLLERVLAERERTQAAPSKPRRSVATSASRSAR